MVGVLDDASRVAVLGCGSQFRGDDEAGTLIAELLQEELARAGALGAPGGSGLPGGDALPGGRTLQAFAGHAAPENLTGEIKAMHPDLLLVIDAVDLGVDVPAGEAALVHIDDIAGVSFSTHMLPLKIVLDYLARELDCRICLLGIQLASIEFMAQMHPAVRQTVDETVATLLSWQAARG